MQIVAPAKINLWLRVLGRRPDGFHEIESLFVPVDLADSLTVELAQGGGIVFECDDSTLPTGSENLVVRAAEAFFEAIGQPPHATLRLEKSIPSGAGLGGGSSDAAATLRALNELSGFPLAADALLRLAAGLGSDVPFFLGGTPAICRGRGEAIEPMNFPKKLPVLLVKPPFAVPTPWAYGRWREARELPGVDYAAQPLPFSELINDLERPVFEKFLLLAELKTWLREQPETQGALMSGSGATVFAVLHDHDSAELLARRVRAEFGETFWLHAGWAG